MLMIDLLGTKRGTFLCLGIFFFFLGIKIVAIAGLPKANQQLRGTKICPGVPEIGDGFCRNWSSKSTQQYQDLNDGTSEIVYRGFAEN